MKLSAVGVLSLSIVNFAVASPVPNTVSHGIIVPSIAEIKSAISQFQGMTRSALASTNSTLSLDTIDPLWDPLYALTEGDFSAQTSSINRRPDVELTDIIANYVERLYRLTPASSRKRSVSNDATPGNTPDSSLERLQSWADGTLPIPAPYKDGVATRELLTIGEVQGFTDALQELIVRWRSKLESTAVQTDSDLAERSVAAIETNLRKRLDPITAIACLVFLYKWATAAA